MTSTMKIAARIAIVIVALVTAAAVVASLLSGPSADALSTLNPLRKSMLIAAMCTAIIPVFIALSLRHGKALVTTSVGSVVVIVVTAVAVFVV